MIKEEWKVLDFIGYYNYAISNWGRVKSLNYNHTGKEKMAISKFNFGKKEKESSFSFIG